MTTKLKTLLAKGAAISALACSGALALTVWDERRTLEAWRTEDRLVPAAKSADVQFVDVTTAAGIRFYHNNGAFGASFFPEQMGSGAAFIDYNNDGYQDIFFVNGRDWSEQEIKQYKQHAYIEHARKYGFDMPSPKARRRTTGALYHNNGDGTFSDVTKQSGLDIEMYGMGASVSDYDNDGDTDLFVSAVGRNYLFQNDGRGRFREVATEAGVRGSGFNTSAAFLDYDRDGWLDLFVGRYIEWSPATDSFFFLEGRKSASPPTIHLGQTCRLYRNVRGKFQDVSAAAGIESSSVATGAANQLAGQRGSHKLTKVGRKLIGKALGVAVVDSENDGWPDIVVANDSEPNFVFVNNRDGTFSERGVSTGVAYGPNGRARNGMGIDSGDIDASSQEAIVIGNFSDQSLGLYRAESSGLYNDVAATAGVAEPSNPFITFGCMFADVDNDGHLDILVVNGNVQTAEKRPESGRITPMSVRQRPLLFQHKGTTPATFEEIGLASGPGFLQEVIGRGLACADIDLDGDVDILLTTKAGPPSVLRNKGGNKKNSIRLTLQGIGTPSGSNRSAIGAVVEARFASNRMRRSVKSGSSYLSQSELPLTLGLGDEESVTELSIHWPSGRITRFQNIASNQRLLIGEDKGIIEQKPLARSDV